MTSKKYDFIGKVALITGSSSGIGAACALQFAKCGANVAITGIEAEEVQQMVSQIKALTGEAPFSLVGNLTEDGFPEKLVNATVETYGQLDILINNAGRACAGDSFLNPDFMSKYDLQMDLNIKTVFRMIHLCVPHLSKTKGCIVNTASIASFSPALKSPLYCASKAAVSMITKSAALELGPLGIRVNSINPGPIRTNLGRSVGAPQFLLGETSTFSDHSIMKRNGEPDEVANMVLFLTSDEASYITGANYLVDGGYMCV